MAEHRVVFQGTDIFGKPVSVKNKEISFDNKNTWRSLTPDEEANGVQVTVGQQFVARLSNEHYWPVTQTLVIEGASSPILRYAGPVDAGAESVSSTAYNAGLDGVYTHIFSAWITLFREAETARAANGNTPPNPYMFNCLCFSGLEVLSASGSGLGRFAGQVRQNVHSYGPGIGTLRFVRTVDSSVPQLSAVLIPEGVSSAGPVSICVFFAPHTGGRKIDPYPYSKGANSYNQMIEDYLTQSMHRLAQQVVAARKNVVFVFPVPPPIGYLQGVAHGESLRKFCRELAFWLKREIGGERIPATELGPCALAGFSEGGVPLHAVIDSIGKGSSFPELHEVYCLDVVPPAGNSQDTSSYSGLLDTLAQWTAQDSERRVRIYTQFPNFEACTPGPLNGVVTRTNAGAREYQTQQGTFVYTPVGFWDQVSAEEIAPSSFYPYFDKHHLMTCVFLEHALVASDFSAL